MPDLAIDRLKHELTDKYVIVTGERPELARFAGYVGLVKTVNFSGRALVEFTGYLNNPAWFDIDPACLRVVDEPPKPDPLAAKAARPASKVPVKAAGASAADVLAAIRGGAKSPPKPDAAGRTPASAAPAIKPAAKKPDAAPPSDAPDKPSKRVSPSVGQSTADILAAARAAKKPSQQPADEGKVEGANKAEGKRTSPSIGLSTAEVLAAARRKKPAPAADANAASPSSEDASPAPKKPTAPRSSGMTTEEILAAARAAKKPAAATAKTSAIDDLAATTKKNASPHLLTAEEIRDIGLGKFSIRREPVVYTTPLPKKPHVDSPDPHIAALPKKLDESHLTALDIQKMGQRK